MMVYGNFILVVILLICCSLKSLTGLVVSIELECENGWKLKEGSCYKMVENRLTWSNAKKACESDHGGKLSEPNTQTSFDFVKQILNESNQELCWLGGTDKNLEGVFVWSSVGKNITLDKWDDSQPNNRYKNQDCLEVWRLNKIREYKWNDWFCGDRRMHICEKQARQSIIKYAEVQEGDNLTLPCPVRPPLPVDVLSVYWSTPSNAQMTTDLKRYYDGGSLANPSLVMTSVRQNDTGIYVCNSNATTGPRMYAFYVNVTGDKDETNVNIQCKCNDGSVSPNTKYQNLTHDELVLKLEPVLQEIRREISVNKTNLSSQIRKRTSASDKRKSSKAIGCVGIMFISIGLGAIVIFDVVSLLRFLGLLHI